MKHEKLKKLSLVQQKYLQITIGNTPSTKSRKNIAGKNFPPTSLCFHEALNLILQILKKRNLAVQKSDYTAKKCKRGGKGNVSMIQRKKVPKLLGTWKVYSNQCPHLNYDQRAMDHVICMNPASFFPRHA